MTCDNCNNESLFEVEIETDDGPKMANLCKECYYKYLMSTFSEEQKKRAKGNLEKTIRAVVDSMEMDIRKKLIQKQKDTINNFINGGEGLSVNKEKKCSFCNTKYDIVKKSGEFGCEYCYDEFSDDIVEKLYHEQCSINHKGKVPKEYKKLKDINDYITKAEIDLVGLINREKFEKASELRDKINKLKTDLKNASGDLNGRKVE